MFGPCRRGDGHRSCTNNDVRVAQNQSALVLENLSAELLKRNFSRGKEKYFEGGREHLLYVVGGNAFRTIKATFPHLFHFR